MPTYRLTPRWFKIMTSRYGDRFRCTRCDQGFQPGQTIVSRKTHPKKSETMRWYHYKCWKELLL